MRQILQQVGGNFIEEARGQVVARLAVQHARLREAQVEPLARARDGDVHQPALLFQPLVFVQRVLVREQPFFQPADEDDVELQALGRMHGHQLQRVVAFAGLVLAGFERGMGEEGREVGRQFAFLADRLPSSATKPAAALTSSSRLSSRSWPSFSFW